MKFYTAEELNKLGAVQARAQHFTLGGQKLRGRTFFSKKVDDLYCYFTQ